MNAVRLYGEGYGLVEEIINGAASGLTYGMPFHLVEATPNSMPSTSMVKSIPPTGALKIAAIPAPAPQAIMTVSTRQYTRDLNNNPRSTGN